MNSDAGNLANLHDIVPLQPVSWWPLAPGWYVLAFIIASLAFVFAWRARRRWLAQRYRRQALDELRAIQHDSLEPAVTAANLMTLLKRTALSAYPRQQVAGLTGEDWWSFLDQCTSGETFREQLGPKTSALVYSDSPSIDASTAIVQQLAVATEYWIRNHAAV